MMMHTFVLSTSRLRKEDHEIKAGLQLQQDFCLKESGGDEGGEEGGREDEAVFVIHHLHHPGRFHIKILNYIHKDFFSK